MFRQMRRKKQQLSQEEALRILHRGTSGVLALSGDEGYPYTVPMSYVYDDGKIYFHCAQSGHKIDAIQRSPKASFCVIDRDMVVSAEYTTYFRSVIAFGLIRILKDEHEKRDAMEKLTLKYAPEDVPLNRERVIQRDWARLCVLEMRIAHITGKESIESVKQRAK